MRFLKAFETRGFEIRVYEDEDPYPDLSHLGTFVAWGEDRLQLPVFDRATRRVIRNSDELQEAYRMERERVRGTSVGTWPSRWGLEHRRRFIMNAGDPKYLEQDAERLEAYELGEWACIGIVVRALRCGVVLGSSSLSGVESDADQKHIDVIVMDLLPEALGEARLKLEQLLESVRVLARR